MDGQESVVITIFEKDKTTPDDLIKKLKGDVIGGNKVEISWEAVYVEDPDDEESQKEQQEKGYTLPEYVFIVETNDGKQKSSESPLLNTVVKIELHLVDSDNRPIPNIKYEVFNLKGDSIACGVLDDNGQGVIDDVGHMQIFVSYNDEGKD